jgi:hypothetical protein
MLRIDPRDLRCVRRGGQHYIDRGTQGVTGETGRLVNVDLFDALR